MDDLAYQVRDVGADPRERAELTAALVGLPARQWAALADRLRVVWPWQTEPEPTDEFRALIAAMFHDGFVRERAVMYFAERPSPLAAFVLALRAAEWVPAVRERARAAYVQLFAGPAEIWLPSTDLVFELERRYEGAWLPPRVREALVDVPVAALDTAGRRARRIAYAARIDRGDLTSDELLALARDDPDGRIRALAVSHVAVADLANLATHRSVHVRQSVLARTKDVGLARAALGDRTAAVRLTAQWILLRAGEDPAAFYRNRLGPNPRTAILIGLAETGTPADVDLVAAYLEHEQPALRKAALHGLRRRGSIGADRITPLLDDPDPAVARLARRTFRTATRNP